MTSLPLSKPTVIATCISGFTQSAQHQSGTLKAARRALGVPSAWVDYMTWDDDQVGRAWYFHRMFPGVPHVIWGYSLGGHAAAIYANQLVDLGERVAGVVCVDGVVKGWWTPWRWVTGKIRFNFDVETVSSYIQRQNKPDGDPVLHGRSEVEQVLIEDTNHNHIDEHRIPHDRFMELIGEVVDG